MIDRTARLLARLLAVIARTSVYHPKSVIALTLAVSAFSLWAASGIELSTDLSDLLPRDLPESQQIEQLRDAFGATEPLVIAVSGEGADDLEDRIDLALALRDRLTELEGVRPVAGAFGDDPWALLEGPHSDALLLYLEPQSLAALPQRVSPEAIDSQVQRNLERLQSPLGPAAARWIAEDPLGLLVGGFEQFRDIKGHLRIDARDGVLVTEDERYVILLARMVGSTHNVGFSADVLERVAALARTQIEEFELEGTAGVGPAPDGARGVHVGLTGAAAIIVDYRNILAADIRKISLVAFIAVLFLFLIAFRRILGLLIAGVPLIVGILATLGFAGLAIGQLNVFTAGAIAILCGLAIDFTIHLYNRYLEEVHADKDMIDAFTAAHGETGLGILAAAATTAWAFLAAGLSSFRGLRDLGLICAAGIVLSLTASLFLVPAMAALASRLRPARDRPKGLAGFYLEPLLRAVVAHARLVVIVGLVGTAILAYPAVRARLDEDFRRFRPTAAPSIQLQTELSERIGTSLQPAIAVIESDDPETLLEKASAVERALRPLMGGDSPQIAALIAPTYLLPPPSRQEQVLDTLRALRSSGAIDPSAAERALLAAYGRHGFRVDDDARRVAERLRMTLSRDEPLTFRGVLDGPLAGPMEDLVIGEPGRDVWRALVTAYPQPNVKTREFVERFRTAIDASGVSAQLVGGRFLSQAIKPLVLRDGLNAILVSAVGVLTILLLTFRRIVLVLLTFLPLVVGLIASVGLMAFVGVDFNLVSVSVLPLILGIGIDNGIHVVHRFLAHRTEDLVDVFHHVGRGIVMTSLTTMVGFGALIFADYPGLVSSGVLAILGVGATLVTAITLLPALLVLVRVRDDRRS